MIEKNLSDVTLEDVQALIDNKAHESKTIEYKSILPGNTDKDKIRYLAAVSSLSNSNGGDLIYGITETKGAPTSIIGVQIDDIDKEILRLENIMRNGIEPRISSYEIKKLEVTENNYIVIIRLQRSWNQPHRVTLNDHSKFYARHSAGKFPLDVEELRSAFNTSKTIIKEIKEFIEERLAAYHSNDLPIPMRDGARILLQIIPLYSLSSSKNIDINELLQQCVQINPIDSSGSMSRINFNGIQKATTDENNKAYGYLQVYRNGIIETATTYEPRGEDKYLPSSAIEKAIRESVESYLSLLENLDMNLPLVTYISFLGIKGYRLAVRDRFPSFRNQTEYYEDILQLPEILIEDFNQNIDSMLKPTFDLIWNTWGLEKCEHYDENGKWQY